MKLAIVYESVTGNTAMLAEKINNSLTNYEVVYCGKPIDGINADIYIVGSWTDKGDCSQKIATFLSMLDNKKVIYFGTAGFGGSEEYYERLFLRIKEKLPASNEVLGHFYCQGKMPISVRNRYVEMIKANPEDKKLQVSIENFDKAQSHPDKIDIENVGHWINNIIDGFVSSNNL